MSRCESPSLSLSGINIYPGRMSLPKFLADNFVVLKNLFLKIV